MTSSVAECDGIATSYQVTGNGPPLLMFSPGGFNATMANWSGHGVYKRVRPIEHLSPRYTCISFDRRESGGSGGRVERVTWADYVAQGVGLLDRLGIDDVYLMGGCQGCSPAIAFAARFASRVRGMVLYWPAGGARYRLSGHARFARHVEYVRGVGLEGTLALARSTDAPFNQDPRIGPWGSILRHDEAFAAEYVTYDPDRYLSMVTAMARTLLDRDTVSGAEPEDLFQLDIPTLIVPGRDASHATSAARYLEECLPRAEYWDVAPDGQTEQTVPPRIMEFLGTTR